MALLVIGGTGFLGTAICRNAVNRGIKVISLSRNWPTGLREDWQKSVKYVIGDAQDPYTYEDILPDNVAVIHTMGGLRLSNRFKLQKQSDEDQAKRYAKSAYVAAKACEGFVTKFVYISTNHGGLYYDMQDIFGAPKVEAWLSKRENYQSAVLRPGWMYDDSSKFMYHFKRPISWIYSLWYQSYSIRRRFWFLRFQAKPLHIETVATCAVTVAFAEFEDDKHCEIFDNEDIDDIAYQES